MFELIVTLTFTICLLTEAPSFDFYKWLGSLASLAVQGVVDRGSCPGHQGGHQRGKGWAKVTRICIEPHDGHSYVAAISKMAAMITQSRWPWLWSVISLSAQSLLVLRPENFSPANVPYKYDVKSGCHLSMQLYLQQPYARTLYVPPSVLVNNSAGYTCIDC